MYTHQYERERAMRDQEATEAMIRMREPRRSTGPHPDPLTDELRELLKLRENCKADEMEVRWTDQKIGRFVAANAEDIIYRLGRV